MMRNVFFFKSNDTPTLTKLKEVFVCVLLKIICIINKEFNRDANPLAHFTSSQNTQPSTNRNAERQGGEEEKRGVRRA